MSHTATALCKMKCSLDVLKRVLEEQFPEWKDFIRVGKDLPFYNFNGVIDKNDRQDNYIIIPGISHKNALGGDKAPGLGYCSVGFHLVSGTPEDGMWAMQSDPMELKYGKQKNLMENVNANIAESKLRAEIAKGIVPGLIAGPKKETNKEIEIEFDGDVDIDDVERVGKRMNLY